MIDLETLRSSGEAEKHADSGTHTAGIDAMRQYGYQDRQWHLHAIEFHHKDKAEAERLRDKWLAEMTAAPMTSVTADQLAKHFHPRAIPTDKDRKEFASYDWKLAVKDAEAALRLLMPAQEPRPLAEYHEDMGSVLWWCWVPAKLERADDGSGPPLYHAAQPAHWLGEAPYVGSPLDVGVTVEAHTTTRVITQVQQDHDPEPHIERIDVGGWPGYHTHFTPLPPLPKAPK